MKAIKENLNKMIKTFGHLKDLYAKMEKSVNNYTDIEILKIFKVGAINKIKEYTKNNLQKTFGDNVKFISLNGEIYAYFKDRAMLDSTSPSFRNKTISSKKVFKSFKNLDFFKTKIPNFRDKFDALEHSNYTKMGKIILEGARIDNVYISSDYLGQRRDIIKEERIFIQERKTICNMENTTNKEDKKCDDSLRSEVRLHIKRVFEFAEKQKIQLNIENLSESILVKFGFKAYKHYNHASMRTRICTLRKIVTGVDNPGKLVHYNRILNNQYFLKHTIQDKYHKNTLIYYSNEKIKLFNEWVSGTGKQDFFIDGTRQLVSIGVDRKQLLTINSTIKNRLYTLAYVYMRDYTAAHYKKIFQLIHDEIKIFNYCNSILIDMEIALISSLSNFGTIRLCYFHVAARMIKRKSRYDKYSDNTDYMRPELVRVAQKIIFVKDEDLDCFFITIIFIFVESEQNLHRQKNAIIFIKYIYNFFVKRLGNKRYHVYMSQNLTNNFAESFNAKLKKKLGYKKNNRFLTDTCFINDFTQMAQTTKPEKLAKKIKSTDKPNMSNIVRTFQNKKQNMGTIWSFLLNNIDYQSQKLVNYNLKKMLLTFSGNEISDLKNFSKSIHSSEFRYKKAVLYDLKRFFENSCLENCINNIEKEKTRIECLIKCPNITENGKKKNCLENCLNNIENVNITTTEKYKDLGEIIYKSYTEFAIRLTDEVDKCDIDDDEMTVITELENNLVHEFMDII